MTLFHLDRETLPAELDFDYDVLCCSVGTGRTLAASRRALHTESRSSASARCSAGSTT
jgi:hypothetical protein